MNANSILILGDSASMTIGMEQCCYAFLLAQTPCWPAATTLINGSQPGITSADAAAYFFKVLGTAPPGAVIIFLGNCDAMNSEVRKGRYTPLRQALHGLKRLAGWSPRRTRLKNRLHHYEWDASFDPLIEQPESPADFEYNIARILRRCSALSIPVVLVRPKANRHFPAGVGKGNFAFYRFVGLPDTFGAALSGRPSLAGALEMHESGAFAAAMACYKELMDAATPSDGKEYSLALLNNYAVAAAESGRAEEAEWLFGLLLREQDARHEIARYNLARMRLLSSDTEGYARLLAEACEADHTMYRVRAPYLEAIDRLARRHSGQVRVVDMHALVPDDLYVDHCHPLPEGQCILAREIAAELNHAGFAGNEPATVCNELFNPELSLGNEEEFYAYFNTFAPYSEEEIAVYVRTVRRMADSAWALAGADILAGYIPRELERAFKYYLTHPCFPTLRDAAAAQPCLPSDVGRFPEFFLLRHLTPYLRAVEADPVLRECFSDNRQGLLRSAQELARPLPPPVRARIADAPQCLEPDQARAYAERILDAVARRMARHLAQGPQIHNRLKSTIYWYFRETLRFGSHSRVTMRYDRIALEYCAEALALAAFHAGDAVGLQAETTRLWSLLNHAADIHERHCACVDLTRPSQTTLADYAVELQNLADEAGGPAAQGGKLHP